MLKCLAPDHGGVPTSHRLFAASVAVIWGLNFLAIDASLQHFPPMFLVALRFGLIAVPTVLLVPRPEVELRWLLGYGLGFGTIQFLFLYAGMYAGMPAGLASLVLQSSAPFTVLLGATLFRDRISGRRLAGLLLASAGLGVVGWEQAGTATLVPFLLVLAGGFGWAIGNVSNARARASSPFRLVLWMSVIPPVPMVAVALALEGPTRIARSLTGWGEPTAVVALAGLGYTVLAGTLLGSWIWAWLMARHPAGLVAPFSMLVPVVGMSAAWLVLDEELSSQELLGAAVVVTGVFLGSTGPVRSARGGTRGKPGRERRPVADTIGQSA